EARLARPGRVARTSAHSTRARVRQSKAAAEHRLRIRRPRKAHSRTPVLHPALYWSPALAADVRTTTPGKLQNTRSVHSRVDPRGIEEAPPVLHLVERRQVVIPQPQVDRQVRRNLPVVLHIRRNRMVPSASL